MRSRKPRKPFMAGYRIDPTLRGDPGAWRSAFKWRLGIDEAIAAVKNAKRTARMILGVDRRAGWEDIRKAYRTLAKAKHPDTGGSKEAFQELQAAYAVLEHAYERGRLEQQE